MDKFKNIFRINKHFLIFLFGIMLIGIVFGSSLPLFLNADDKKLVSEYLCSFVNGIVSGYDSICFFKNGLVNNGLFSTLIWILGISIIGVPIVLFLFFFKCFIVGFSISSIIINYGFKGIVFALTYIFPHHVIDICIYGLLTYYSLIFSLKIIGYIFKKIDFNIRIAFNRYFKIFLFCIFVLLFSVLYESFVNPIILRFIFNLLRL